MAAGRASSPGEGRLGLATLLLVFLYGTAVYALGFPQMPSAAWGVATAVVGVSSAVGLAVVVGRRRPPPLSVGERIYAALYGVFYPVVSVFVLFLMIGLANAVDGLLDLVDVEAMWLRTAGVVFFLVTIPTTAIGSYTDTWGPELVDRDPGVPTGWARFDSGRPERVPRHIARLVVHTVVTVAVIVLALWLQSWWASVIGAVVVAALASSVRPASATESVASSLDEAKAAFGRLGYDIAPVLEADSSMAEQSSVYPLVQPVDFRAIGSAAELAVSVYDAKSGPIDWTSASRLVSAARTLDYSREKAGPPVVPVMLLVDAKPDPSLAEFAAAERLAVVEVETVAGTATRYGAAPGRDYDDLGPAILKAIGGDERAS